MMRRFAVLQRWAAASCIALLGGCAAKGPGPLYMWESFPHQQYSALLRDGVDPNQQIRDMEAHAERARTSNGALPPGFRAHLGMLYISAGNPQRARELWQAERVAFPESAPYMDRLLMKLDGMPATTKSSNPA